MGSIPVADLPQRGQRIAHDAAAVAMRHQHHRLGVGQVVQLMRRPTLVEQPEVVDALAWAQGQGGARCAKTGYKKAKETEDVLHGTSQFRLKTLAHPPLRKPGFGGRATVYRHTIALGVSDCAAGRKEAATTASRR